MRLHLYEPGVETPATHDLTETDARFVDVLDLREDDVLVLLEEDDNSEKFIEIDVTTTVVEVVDMRPNAGFVRNPLKKITLEIHYAGRIIKLHVHGATLVRKVVKKAVAKAGIDPQTAVDLHLRLAGTERDLKDKRPIGSYVPKGEDTLVLDLVHLSRPQG